MIEDVQTTVGATIADEKPTVVHIWLCNNETSEKCGIEASDRQYLHMKQYEMWKDFGKAIILCVIWMEVFLHLVAVQMGNMPMSGRQIITITSSFAREKA